MKEQWNKMTVQTVREIREQYQIQQIGQAKTATNVIELAKRYGLSQQAVRDIALRKKYAWVS